MVEIARAENADAVAHGATGKGNDQVRFELTAAALAPELQVIAPWRQERFRDPISRPFRDDRLRRKEQASPSLATAKKPYSMDRNLLHISASRAGILEDPWFDASAEKAREMYILSVSPEEAPDKAEHVELVFEKGNCVAIGYHELDALLAELGITGVKYDAKITRAFRLSRSCACSISSVENTASGGSISSRTASSA